jgi:hypothetical protein
MILLSGALGMSVVRDISFSLMVDRGWLLGMRFCAPESFSCPFVDSK